MADNDGGGVACAYGVCQSQPGSTETGNMIVNNTLYQGAGGGTCTRLDRQSGLVMENNIIAGCGYAFNNQTAPFSGTINYNLWYATADTPNSGWIFQVGGCGTGVGCGFSGWQSAGFDANGLVGSNPNINTSTYVPNSGSPAIGAGLNLTSLGISALNRTAPSCWGVGCVDTGKARSASGAWDIGATQFSTLPTANPIPMGGRILTR